MGENVPSIVNQKENAETTPRVEHIIFGSNDILIRTVFPRQNSIAICFILVSSPTSEKGTQNAEELIVSADEPSKPAMRDVLELLNKPLIFRGLDEAQEWFNQAKHIYSLSERKKIASFLGITDTDI